VRECGRQLGGLGHCGIIRVLGARC
jgi:hypothetical protein